MRYILLSILIIASVAAFGTIILPKYRALSTLQNQVAMYSANLDTAKKLTESRSALITEYNAIPKADLDNLKTLLPDSVNNIRLIIQIDALAQKNGLTTLRSIDYQVDSQSSSDARSQQTSPYGKFTMSFQTSGQYKNFLSFLSDLEQNLRLVDVNAVDFAVVEPSATQTQSVGPMYKVTLQTYWLKQ